MIFAAGFTEFFHKSNKQINLLQGPNGVQETTCCELKFSESKKGPWMLLLIPFGVVFFSYLWGEAAVGFVTSHHSSCVETTWEERS